MAIFSFTGQDANNTANADTLVVNDSTPIAFTFDSGAETYLGNLPATAGTDEGADDTVSYVNYDGVTVTDATFDITYEGQINWANGNGGGIDPAASYNVMIVNITSGPDVGLTYTIILDPLDPSAQKTTADGMFAHGNHRAGPPGDNVICFARGTLIACENGDIAIEDLQAGDIVNTLSNGPQVIRWINSSKHRSMKSVKPIRIKAGALGENMPSKDLLVSPAHRMVISGWRAEMLFGDKEVLVPAKALVNDSTITVANDLEEFEYFHILFDQHEIVMSNGAPSESFYPVADAIGALETEARDELFALFPELENMDANSRPKAVRPTISAAEAALLR